MSWRRHPRQRLVSESVSFYNWLLLHHSFIVDINSANEGRVLVSLTTNLTLTNDEKWNRS